MKFGRDLPRNEVPEWSSEYINYKGLKKLIKSAQDEVKSGREADLAEFFFSLDRNLENVDGFYNKKYTEYTRRLKLLRERYGASALFSDSTNRDEIEDVFGALLELRAQSRKLQWFGEVNRRGFIKITKKLDKKVATACAQHRYLSSRVEQRPFATNVKLSRDLNEINVWLSKIGDIKQLDDASSTHSSASLSRVSSLVMINLPKELLEDVDRAIRRDDVSAMLNALSEATEYENSESASLYRFTQNLLQRAISSHAQQCISALLQRLPSLDEFDDINKRNCIHRLVINIGRSKANEEALESGPSNGALEDPNSIVPAEAPNMQAPPYASKELESGSMLAPDDKAVQTLAYLLQRLSPNQRSALASKDSFGRLPLHYAAQYGFIVLCTVLLDHMKAWSQFDITLGFDSSYWQDADGNTPLHFSVIGGHRYTTQALLDACNLSTQSDSQQLPGKILSGRSQLLAMATKANFVNIVKSLVVAGADVNFRDVQGETALHTAARFGHVECANAILESSYWHVVQIDIAESTFGWTPLMIASVDGQLPMVEFLIEAGADLGRKDASGWTSKEHAALRGHMDIANLLSKHTSSNETPTPGFSGINGKTTSLGERGSSAKELPNASPVPKPVKSFGHRYLTRESMVLVSLGSMDMRKNVKAVSLDNVPLAEAHATQLDTALSVIVSANGASGEPDIIDLPVQENISTDPIVFHTTDITKVKLVFDLVPTYSGSKDNPIGRGMAMLSSIKPTIGSSRSNLQGDISVPIVAAKTLDYMGSVNFNFLVITPFAHPNMTITEERTYWKTLTSPMVIGHRGLGKNMATRRSLQLGENTIQSFIAAANLGASYVEFDVQLTKDHVPVIYHDFLVSETGIDAPVHSLTLEQFLHINEQRTPKPSRSASPDEAVLATSNGSNKPQNRRNRANSWGSASDLRQENMSERMKHTRDFKQKGFKGNSRGNFIQAPFTTLEEMLKKLPSTIGFNIEMKYPMLHEFEEQETDTYAVELNSFVDSVLKKIYDMNTKRDIIFSSFNPDICLLLSFKQPSIPILFLTDAGTSPVSDIRASSLQEAIRFASRWNLLGVVTAATPLVLCPRLVRVVKESGLVCVSYGTLNNEPANVKLQWKEGIDAVIVDSVLAIRKGLTHAEAEVDVGSQLAKKLENATVNGVLLSQTGDAGALIV